MVPQSVTAYIGLAAAFVTTVCWLPQAIRIIRTRETKAISLSAYGAFTFGILLWLVYGFLQGDLPLILANTVTLALQLTIVVLKLRYG
ncbi:SemiSWEET family sugar transporter [Phreatobacter sp.]|uniref:SemiSWEET family sugar transporter n=1 Tax=Phreatobacter sp. TaxID=1966341 RepID=UPI003F70D9DA